MLVSSTIPSDWSVRRGREERVEGGESNGAVRDHNNTFSLSLLSDT